MRLRSVTALFALVLLLPVGTVQAEYSLAEAINEAGRQRMLTQRIVKSYVQLGLGVADLRSETELRHAMELFQSQLERLYQVDDSPPIHRQLEQVESIWASFRRLASEPVTQQRAKALLVMSGVLLSECHKLVMLLEQQADIPLGGLINIAGRQRMLSQRLATFYLMRSWGVEHAGMAVGIRNTRAEFVKAQATLRDNALDNLEIAEQLAQIDQDWAWFESALVQPEGERYDLVVMDASEELLHSLEYLVALYELEASPPETR